MYSNCLKDLVFGSEERLILFCSMAKQLFFWLLEDWRDFKYFSKDDGGVKFVNWIIPVLVGSMQSWLESCLLPGRAETLCSKWANEERQNIQRGFVSRCVLVLDTVSEEASLYDDFSLSLFPNVSLWAFCRRHSFFLHMRECMSVCTCAFLSLYTFLWPCSTSRELTQGQKQTASKQNYADPHHEKLTDDIFDKCKCIISRRNSLTVFCN